MPLGSLLTACAPHTCTFMLTRLPTQTFSAMSDFCLAWASAFTTFRHLVLAWE